MRLCHRILVESTMNSIDFERKIRYFEPVRSINSLILKSAFQMASHVKAKAILIHVDPLDNFHYKGRFNKKVTLYLLSKKKKLENGEEEDSLLTYCKALIPLPKTPLSRSGVVKFATTTALSLDYIERGDKVVCVTGSSDIGLLDHIQVLDTGKESEIVASKGLEGITESMQPEVFQAVLLLSVELAQKGREGKPLGTIFVVGDEEKVLPLTKQMIINPFKGYDEEERNIVSPSIKETIREFAAMDGAFVISGEGIVLTAGAYLGAAMDTTNVPRGLGSRHMAAAGITNLTKAVAFVISESSGEVRIFKNGKIITQIEKTTQ